ncbi:hypothetical protein [Pseudomonas sp. NPDC007930]|uniref:hypothetical protein n=1 Tax=Pseudomonas sp. NPDC007930 TaxID=3364417 RepID=UPI0036F040E8
MIRRLAAIAHPHHAQADARQASPLALPMLSVGVLLIGAGLACANPVEMLIGGICLAAAAAQR